MRVLMTVLLLLVMAVSGASAQSDESPDLLALAQLAPDDSEIFLAARIDDDYLATLDGLVAMLAGAGADLGMTVPENLPRIQDLVATGFDRNATPEQVDAVLALLGDTAAASTRMVDGRSVFGVYLTVTDREALVAAINPVGLGLNEAGVVGRFTLYRSPNTPTALLVADDLAIITDDDAALIASGDYPKLAALSTFAEAAAALPASSYNVLTYVSATSVTNTLNNEDIFTRPGGLLLGATILDSGALSLDLAFSPLELESVSVTSIDPAFARFIPADANAVIHSTNLGGGLQTLAELSQQTSGQDMIAGFEQLTAVFGLTFDQFLTLTSGDYVLFSRLDLRGALEAGTATNPTVLTDYFDMALVLEATDPALAAEFDGRIAELLNVGAQDQDFTVSTVTVGETEVTRLDLVIPENNIPLALGIAATDEVFVVGTFGAVEQVLTGAPAIDTQPAYTAAAADLLPNPVVVAYADGSAFSGLFVSVGFVGSSVNSVFEEVQNELDGTTTMQPVGTPVVEDFTPQVLAAYDRLVQLLRYGTVSATITDAGVYVARATITLGE